LDDATKDEQKAIYNTDIAEYKAKHKTWTLKDEKAHGTILLYLSATIQTTQKAITARNLWSELDEEFNQSYNMTIFSDFKYYLVYHLSGHSDPMPDILKIEDLSQLCYRPVVTYYMVYYYTKRAMLARLLANEGPVIYVVHLNRYFVIPP